MRMPILDCACPIQTANVPSRLRMSHPDCECPIQTAHAPSRLRMSHPDCECPIQTANVPSRLRMSHPDCECPIQTANVPSRLRMSHPDCACPIQTANVPSRLRMSHPDCVWPSQNECACPSQTKNVHPRLRMTAVLSGHAQFAYTRTVGDLTGKWTKTKRRRTCVFGRHVRRAKVEISLFLFAVWYCSSLLVYSIISHCRIPSDHKGLSETAHALNDPCVRFFFCIGAWSYFFII